MKANKKDDHEDFEAGDYTVFSRKDGTFGILYCCPQCGVTSSGTDKHRYDHDTESLSPSIIHKCGWHGWLRSGQFLKA